MHGEAPICANTPPSDAARRGPDRPPPATPPRAGCRTLRALGAGSAGQCQARSRDVRHVPDLVRQLGRRAAELHQRKRRSAPTPDWREARRTRARGPPSGRTPRRAGNGQSGKSRPGPGQAERRSHRLRAKQTGSELMFAWGSPPCCWRGGHSAHRPIIGRRFCPTIRIRPADPNPALFVSAQNWRGCGLGGRSPKCRHDNPQQKQAKMAEAPA